MSLPDYNNLPEPETTYNADFLIQIKEYLKQELNDPVNSNFLNKQTSSSQTINAPLLIEVANDDDDDTDNRIAKKKFVRNKITALKADDNDFTGVNVFQNKLRVWNDPIVDNDVVNLRYFNANNAPSNVDVNGNNTFTGSNNTFTGSLTINDNALNQSKINGLSASLASKAGLSTDNTYTGKQYFGQVVVNTSISVPTNSLQLTNVNGLSTALAGKQPTINSTNQIAQNCITNLETDLTARPTLTNLQDGTLNLGIDTLTVNHIIATNQTVQYSEMDISNNEIPQVKVNNLVSDLGTMTTNITNLSNTVDLKANASDVTTSLSSKVDVSTYTTDMGNKVDVSTYTTDMSNKVDTSTYTTDMSNKVDTSTYNTAISNLQDQIDVLSNETDISLTDANTWSGIQTINDLVVATSITVPNNSLSISKINNLQSSLDGKVDTSTYTTDLSNKLEASSDVNFTGLISFNTSLPTSTISPTTQYQLCNKAYVDYVSHANDASLSGDNSFSGLNSFSTLPTCSQSVTSNNQLTNKTYVDGQLSSGLAGKQDTLSNASYLDATSSVQTQLDSKASTSALTSGLAGKQDTLSNASFLDATSSVQTQLDSKASTSSLTSALADKQDTITTTTDLSIRNLTASGTLDFPNASVQLSDLQTTGSITSTTISNTGNAKFGSISENLNSITTGTNNFTLDYSTCNVFFLTTGTTLNANFAVRLNNCGTDTAKNISFTLIYATTGKWYCNSITAYTNTSTQITLSSSTPLFLGGTPNISTSTVMIQQFTLIRNFASNYCLSNVASFY